MPRLNDVGYKFRRAGFRMPEQIAQEETADFEVGNYFSAHVAIEYSVEHTTDTRMRSPRVLAFHRDWLYLIPELQYRTILGNDVRTASMLLHAVAIY